MLCRREGLEPVGVAVSDRLAVRLAPASPSIGVARDDSSNTASREVAPTGGLLASARRRGRREPWRDWAILSALLHVQLIAVAVSGLTGGWMLVVALPVGLTLATATLTVLHDAGHRRFAQRSWPNVLAVQSAAPVGLWTAHWTLKHRVHHRVTQLYPLDEATRSTGLIRLHPAATWRPVHRRQHLYGWALYSLAWAGELRSQLTFLRTGAVAGAQTPGPWRRAGSFLAEKALCATVLLPYAVAMGIVRLGLLLLVAMTVASLVAAAVLVVGHINLGIEPPSTAPTGQQWLRHQVLTSASFSTDNVAVRWLTGGMTHHLAHHLRPVAARADLPALHRTVIHDEAARSGTQVREFATFRSAVRGHYARLRELGKPPEAYSQDAVIGQPLRDLVANRLTGAAVTPSSAPTR